MRSVAVAGGGITGWAAAAALKRRLPHLDVTILPLAPPEDAFADRLPATLPSVLAFHGDLGLSEADAIVRTRAAFRLGTRFVGWAEGLPDYVHSYGAHGQAIAGSAFHQHWLRTGNAPFDRYAPAAALGRQGRFLLPGEPPVDGYEYGLVLDLSAQTAMLRAFARHLGVREAVSKLRSVRHRVDGCVEAIETEAGPLVADLFVDATGPDATLRSAVGGDRTDWQRWLPCDRLAIDAAPTTAPPASLDMVEAIDAGWRFRIEGAVQTTTGTCWSSAHNPRGDGIGFAAGSHAEPWSKNVVAIGDAATVVEPLEWTNLHLALSGIDRLVTMMPDRDCAPVEIAEFNRQARDEATRVRDFLLLHYVIARRPEPFWCDMAAIEPPDTLAHTLTQFTERGRLPFYEEETFARDSWLAVLIGQGVRPRRIDPMVEAIDPAPIAAGMARHREALAAAAGRAPTHAAFLQALHRQVLS
jgi:tryptophan halogenase